MGRKMVPPRDPRQAVEDMVGIGSHYTYVGAKNADGVLKKKKRSSSPRGGYVPHEMKEIVAKVDSAKRKSDPRKTRKPLPRDTRKDPPGHIPSDPRKGPTRAGRHDPRKDGGR